MNKSASEDAFNEILRDESKQNLTEACSILNSCRTKSFSAREGWHDHLWPGSRFLRRH